MGGETESDARRILLCGEIPDDITYDLCGAAQTTSQPKARASSPGLPRSLDDI